MTTNPKLTINMDIIITGGAGCGKTAAAHKLLAAHFGIKTIYEARLSQLLIINNGAFISHIDVLRETIRAARVEAVLFDENLITAGDLVTAVRAVNEARKQIGRDLFVVYVRCTEGALTMAKYPNNLDSTSAFFNGVAVTEVGTPISDSLSVSQAAAFASTMRRYPLTLNPSNCAYEAAELQDGSAVVCRAVNVYHFETANKRVLFELSEIIGANQLHVAVDKLNTRYFATGNFPQAAYNAEFCRPAKPAEVLEYLNAKYEYEKANSN